jgi:hypothetical protein
MAAKKSPLARVKEKFESKEKLVDALVGLPAKVLDRAEDEDKDAFRTKLLAAANAKLLKLYERSQAIQTRYGSKEGLVEALLTLQNRGKDKDYRGKLGAWTLGRLYDRVTTLEKSQKRAQSQS